MTSNDVILVVNCGSSSVKFGTLSAFRKIASTSGRPEAMLRRIDVRGNTDDCVTLLGI